MKKNNNSKHTHNTRTSNFEKKPVNKVAVDDGEKIV